MTFAAPCSTDRSRRNTRFRAAAAALTLEGGLIALLVMGLTPALAPVRQALGAITALTLPPDRPQPHSPARYGSSRPGGAAAPEGHKGKASPVIAPPRTLTSTNPIQAAVQPRLDRGPASGSGVGLGSGAGGVGAGAGSGAGGQGDGAGDGGSDPEWTGGRIKDSDYPRAAREAHISGTTQVQIAVGSDGRVTRCQIAHGSGNADLDAATCRLVEQRFRFRPARDAAGRPVPAEVEYDQEWDAPPPE